MLPTQIPRHAAQNVDVSVVAETAGNMRFCALSLPNMRFTLISGKSSRDADSMSVRRNTVLKKPLRPPSGGSRNAAPRISAIHARRLSRTFFFPGSGKGLPNFCGRGCRAGSSCSVPKASNLRQKMTPWDVMSLPPMRLRRPPRNTGQTRPERDCRASNSLIAHIMDGCSESRTKSSWGGFRAPCARNFTLSRPPSGGSIPP